MKRRTPAGAPLNAAVIWSVDPHAKILSSTLPPRESTGKPPKALRLRAARNESEPFQIAIHAHAPLVIRSLHCSDLVKQGASIPSRSLWLRHVELVPVRFPTSGIPAEELVCLAPAFIPDPILRQQIRYIPPGQTRSVWGNIAVPAKAEPGKYRGHVSVDTSHGVLRIPLSLEVLPFALPRARSFDMSLWFWPEIMAEAHRVELWGEGFWDLLSEYAANMASHGQTAILTPHLFGPGLVEARRTARGEYRFDFSRFDRWIGIFLRAGFRWIEGAHLAAKDNNLPEARWPMVTMPLSVFDEKEGRLESHPAVPFSIPLPQPYGEVLDAFLPALVSHLEAKGWRKRFLLHVSDEPNEKRMEPYLFLVRYIRERAAGIPLIDAVSQPASAEALDIPVPLMSFHHKDEALYSRMVASGKRVWTYNANGPRGAYPNRYLDQPLLKIRIVGWLCWRYGLSGYLHWGLNFWRRVWYLPDARGKLVRVMSLPGNSNPWLDASSEAPLTLPPGDPFIIYSPRPAGLEDKNLMHPPLEAGASPLVTNDTLSEHPGIVDSIRWEMTRKASDDYEYLCLLSREISRARKDGRRAEADKAQRLLSVIIEKVAADWTSYTRDPEVLLRARARIAREIIALRRGRIGRQ